jgi:2-aminoethylphosphonate-pyruvate transaminase
VLLLNPGPVTLSERVRRSMLQPDLCHREGEFFDLQDEARRRLLATYSLDPAQWAAVLMTAAIAAQLASRPTGSGFTHVAIVHHETTTGRLNDLRALAALCREQGAVLLVDAVSSFGAEAIDFTDPALSAVAATANKCLHAVPGVAFVIARHKDLQNAVSPTYYLDLARLARLQGERNTPFTPAVHAYYALVEALREYEEQGGRSARYDRYAARAERVRAGLAPLGIPAAIPAGESSVVLRAYKLPSRLSYAQLHDALKADGFVIYAGQGNLAKSLFRISTMGNLTSADIDRLVLSFARQLQ